MSDTNGELFSWLDDLIAIRDQGRSTLDYGDAISSLSGLLNEKDPKIIKKVISAATVLFPHIFEFALVDGSARGAEAWTATGRFKKALNEYLYSEHAGIAIVTVKFLQTVVLVQSRGRPIGDVVRISLYSVRPGHRLLESIGLERESQDIIATLISMLHSKISACSVLSSVINALGLIAKERPQFEDIIVPPLAKWNFPPPSHLAPLQAKFIAKAIKNVFVVLMKMEPALRQRDEIIATVSALGGDNDVALYHRARAKARKRPLAPENNNAGAEKRTKIETPPPPPPPPPHPRKPPKSLFSPPHS
ncbi:uncharacterized protein VTP21DRAFT_4568 [Calcarisporiella thermophila]|uniref:uncharacterized protein n=1 Tax=Calcarisporiella thermophila TaxID=911321 RepID=UPI0037446744